MVYGLSFGVTSVSSPFNALTDCTVAVVVRRPLDSERAAPRSTAASSSHAEFVLGQRSAQQHAAVLCA
jgi:hypothetical protein